MKVVTGRFEILDPDPLLRFEEENHRYFYDDREVAGTTGPLKDLGIPDFSKIPKRNLDRAAIRGTYIHKAIHLHILGKLDWDNLDDRIRPYLDGFGLFWQSTDFHPVIVERPFYNERLDHAGTPDAFGYYFGAEVVVDWKSCLVHEDNLAQRLQTMLYSMFPDGQPSGIARYALQLTNKGRFKMVQFRDREDRYLAESAIALHHEKMRSR